MMVQRYIYTKDTNFLSKYRISGGLDKKFARISPSIEISNYSLLNR